MRINVIIAAIVACLLFPVLALAGEVVIIGNSSVSTSSLSQEDVSYIFLGKKRIWEDGERITFAIQKKSDTHDEFLKQYVKKTPTQFSNYWKKQIFTGKGSSPHAVNTDQEMLKFVAETKGAVGYVSSGTSLNNVKTISVE